MKKVFLMMLIAFIELFDKRYQPKKRKKQENTKTPEQIAWEKIVKDSTAAKNRGEADRAYMAKRDSFLNDQKGIKKQPTPLGDDLYKKINNVVRNNRNNTK